MERKIKLKDFVEHILKHMTAEEALTKLIATQVSHYEKLRLEKQPEDNPETVSPYFIIMAAALDLGWQIAFEENHDKIRGLSLGTDEYMKTLFEHKKDLDDGIQSVS